MTRRVAFATAALAAVAGLAFNLPADAENAGCAELQAAYVATPSARPQILLALQALQCSVPNVNPSTTAAPTTTAPASTTTSTTNPAKVACAELMAAYIANPAGRATLLPLLQQAGCTIPVITTTSTTKAPTTTSSSTIPVVTIPPLTASCASVTAAYNAIPESRPTLIPILLSLGCSIPSASA